VLKIKSSSPQSNICPLEKHNHEFQFALKLSGELKKSGDELGRRSGCSKISPLPLPLPSYILSNPIPKALKIDVNDFLT
jgi:hypothetical protein